MSTIGKGDLLRCVGNYPAEWGLPKGSVWVCEGIVAAPFISFCRGCLDAGINEQVVVELEGVTLPQFYEGQPLAGPCPCGFVPILKPPPEAAARGLDVRAPTKVPEPA